MRRMFRARVILPSYKPHPLVGGAVDEINSGYHWAQLEEVIFFWRSLVKENPETYTDYTVCLDPGFQRSPQSVEKVQEVLCFSFDTDLICEEGFDGKAVMGDLKLRSRIKAELVDKIQDKIYFSTLLKETLEELEAPKKTLADQFMDFDFFDDNIGKSAQALVSSWVEELRNSSALRSPYNLAEDISDILVNLKNWQQHVKKVIRDNDL